MWDVGCENVPYTEVLCKRTLSVYDVDRRINRIFSNLCDEYTYTTVRTSYMKIRVYRIYIGFSEGGTCRDVETFVLAL